MPDDDPLYTPGAWWAKSRMGCTCPRLDNDEGWGKLVEIDGEYEREFLIQPGCPCHDLKGGNNVDRIHP